jgi:hypothetical protein
MPKLPLQNQGFEIAHRRAHAAIALAKRDKHRVERLLGKAGLRKPRPQMRPVPKIEGDLRHLVILENFFEARGDKFVADRCAGRRFEIALACPQIIRRMVARRLFRQTIGRQPEDWPHMPYAVVGSQWPRTSAVRSPLSERSRPPNTLSPVMSRGSSPHAVQAAWSTNGVEESTRWLRTRFRYSFSREGMRMASFAIASTSRLFMKASTAGLAARMASSEKGSSSGGAV